MGTAPGWERQPAVSIAQSNNVMVMKWRMTNAAQHLSEPRFWRFYHSRGSSIATGQGCRGTSYVGKPVERARKHGKTGCSRRAGSHHPQSHAQASPAGARGDAGHATGAAP